jgi:hypothetical protein
MVCEAAPDRLILAVADEPAQVRVQLRVFVSAQVNVTQDLSSSHPSGPVAPDLCHLKAEPGSVIDFQDR